MTTCAQDPDLVERYVTGKLSEDECGAFEEHFFECVQCLARVHTLQGLQQELDKGPVASAAPRRNGLRRTYTSWLAAAALLILTVAVWQMWRTPYEPTTPQTTATNPAGAPPASSDNPPVATPSPAPSVDPEARLAQLAMVTPPRFLALATRTEETQDTKAFNAAIKAYSAGDYDTAAARLRPLVPRSGLPHAAFFLGISELMAGRLEPARAALRNAAASGAPPYAAEAHFYLAKIDLRTGDLDAAARELNVAVREKAGPPGAARQLLSDVQALRR